MAERPAPATAGGRRAGGGAPATVGGRTLTPRAFALFRSFVYREAGIHLANGKEALVAGRLARRLRELGLDSYEAYYDYATRVDGNERVHLLDAITTNETHFFREPQHFDFLERQVFPAWRAAADAGTRPRVARVWSAACSTGQEPYTLAMLLLTHLPPEEGWDVRVLGTDLSTRVLARAEEAVWPVHLASEIPRAHLRRWMLRGVGSQEGLMRAGPELRAVTRFRRFNLTDARYPSEGPFDLIFCRNVLIYFDAASKAKVVERLLASLVPDGHLVLGHAETLSWMPGHARAAANAVYVRPDGPLAAAAAARPRTPRAPGTRAFGARA